MYWNKRVTVALLACKQEITPSRLRLLDKHVSHVFSRTQGITPLSSTKPPFLCVRRRRRTAIPSPTEYMTLRRGKWKTSLLSSVHAKKKKRKKTIHNSANDVDAARAVGEGEAVAAARAGADARVAAAGLAPEDGRLARVVHVGRADGARGAHVRLAARPDGADVVAAVARRAGVDGGSARGAAGGQ